MRNLLDPIRSVAVAAGKEILAVYHAAAPMEVTVKHDRSPLTEADTRANRLIERQLQQIDSSIPILSEESDQPEFAVRRNWRRYWLVDPLDGTREFLHRNGEFTVNIALIEAGRPVLGVVHVPVSGVSYFGGAAVAGAWKQAGSEQATPIQVSTVAPQTAALRVLLSRRHRGALTDELLARLRTRFRQVKALCMGSSLKLCWLAEGKADLCPRLAPTSEWDTAAAHAILCAAGGKLLTADFGSLRYNLKDSVLNPHFLAIGDTGFDWQSLLYPLPTAGPPATGG